MFTIAESLGCEMSLLRYARDNNDISINRNLFTENRKVVFEIFVNYYKAYHSVIKDIDTFNLIVRQKAYPVECLATFAELDFAKHHPKEYLQDVLWDYYRIRETQQGITEFNNSLNKRDISVADSQRRFISHLLNIRNLNDKIKQGFIWDNVKERWEEYKEKERNPIKMEGIPTHFAWWDRYCSGAVKGRLYMIYGPPKAGKSTLKANIGYNISVYEHEDVMYISGEMPKSKLELVFDARETMIESALISNGNLAPSSREKFKEALRNIFTRKDPFYIVQPKPGFTTEDLIGYKHAYEKKTGRKLKVMIVDYLRKMTTSRKNTAKHEELDYITEELFENLAKGEDLPVIISTHENRAGKIARRKGEENGSENIDGSYRIGGNVNALFLIESFHNSKKPELINKMRVSCEINRDGPSFSEDMEYLKDRYYVGNDRVEIPGTEEKKKDDQPFIERDFD